MRSTSLKVLSSFPILLSRVALGAFLRAARVMLEHGTFAFAAGAVNLLGYQRHVYEMTKADVVEG